MYLKQPVEGKIGPASLPSPDFRVLFESAPGLYLVLTRDFRILAASDAYLRATKTKREEIVGRDAFSVFPDNPADPTATGVRNITASLERVLQNRVPDALEVQKYDIRRPESEGGGFEERYWSAVSSPVFGATGEIICIIHRVEDVTDYILLKRQGREQERIAAELRSRSERLRESEMQYRSVVEGTIQGIAIQQGGFIRFANPALARIFGYAAPEELVGRRWQLLVAPEALAVLQERIDASLGGQAVPVREGWQGMRKDGTRIWVESGLAPIQWQNRPAILSFVLDVTQRKQQEAALRENEERLRIAFEHTGVATAHTDINHRFVRVNAAFAELFGHAPPELLNLSLGDVVHPDDLAECMARREDLLAGQTAYFEHEKRCLHKDGQVFWGLASVSLLRDRHGRATEFAIQVQDITERKEAEAEVQKALAELARSNAELEQFAYVASHDLQEPLRAVSGCVQVLQKRYRGKLDDFADELIAHTVDGAARMQNLINDLLAYSRVGRRGQEFKAIDSAAVVKGALANLEVALQESGASVTVQPLPEVKADASQLTQVFQNLVGNALKFRGEHAPAIEIAAQRHENGWRFSVADNGIGIAPEYFERIFVIFQRLHTRKEYPGTGMGLSICKKIVERHGGRIWVESTPGRGTTFFFTLPDRGP